MNWSGFFNAANGEECDLGKLFAVYFKMREDQRASCSKYDLGKKVDTKTINQCLNT